MLSWAFETSLNCSAMCKPPRWFEYCFRRSSLIRLYWLLLTALSDYFGYLVTSTIFLCKFWGLPGSTPVSFPVMRRSKCLGLKRSSQLSSTMPGKRAEKTCRNGSRRGEASNAKSSVCSILNQKRWKRRGNWKRVSKIICMQCVLCVCKSSLTWVQAQF